MSTFLALGFLVLFLTLLIQFARQEEIQDDYEDAIGDVEGRLEWAYSRSSFPFGMKAQLDVSKTFLRKAKRLWRDNKWHQAYRVVLQSQAAMNKAQSIYSSAIRIRRQSSEGN